MSRASSTSVSGVADQPRIWPLAVALRRRSGELAPQARDRARQRRDDITNLTRRDMLDQETNDRLEHVHRGQTRIGSKSFLDAGEHRGAIADIPRIVDEPPAFIEDASQHGWQLRGEIDELRGRP